MTRPTKAKHFWNQFYILAMNIKQLKIKPQNWIPSLKTENQISKLKNKPQKPLPNPPKTVKHGTKIAYTSKT